MRNLLISHYLVCLVCNSPKCDTGKSSEEPCVKSWMWCGLYDARVAQTIAQHEILVGLCKIVAGAGTAVLCSKTDAKDNAQLQ